MIRAVLPWALVLLGACSQEGTISISLAFPPGQTRLPPGAVSARLTLTAPGLATVVETAPIAADGSFDVAVATDATGAGAQITLDALDAGGAVVARGLSPPLPLAAFDEALRVYMAPPGRFTAAPVALPEARAEVAVAPLSYGVAFAGGRTADGSRSDHVEVYSLFTHALTIGAALPAPRARLAAAGGAFDQVYLFGGLGTGDNPVSDLLRFDTAAPPAGRYTSLSSDGSLARAGAQVAPLGANLFLVTGAPPVLLDASNGRAGSFQNATADAGQATTAATTGTTAGAVQVILAGGAGVVLYDLHADKFTTVAPDVRREQAAVTLPTGTVLVIGGRDGANQLLASALQVTTLGAVTTIPLLARPRRQATAAVARTTLVVAGGFDDAGNALDDAELFDAQTLAPMGTTPLVVPRGGAVAQRLVNGEVLLVGGRSAEGGAPTAVVEIFTP